MSENTKRPFGLCADDIDKFSYTVENINADEAIERYGADVRTVKMSGSIGTVTLEFTTQHVPEIFDTPGLDVTRLLLAQFVRQFEQTAPLQFARIG